LILEAEGHFQKLPWWFVKSKAKHFGIGLLKNGARRGEYFYLFPTSRPTWIYAELGALTVGLQTLPLPVDLSAETWEQLTRAFPPAFVFAKPEDYLRLLPRFKGSKARVILDSDELNVSAKGGPASGGGENKTHGPVSFRLVFNSAIISENRHHAAYREIRRSLTEATVMSPIQVTPEGAVLQRDLTYAHVNHFAANLSRACRQKKIRRLLAHGDLTVTLVRGACLYWPLSLGIPVVLSPAREDLRSQLKAARPNALYLQARDWRDLETWLSGLIPLGGRFQRLFSRLRLRLGWGRALQVLLSTDPAPDSLSSAPEPFGRLPWIQLSSDWLEEAVSEVSA
jgi:hypothetical protein